MSLNACENKQKKPRKFEKESILNEAPHCSATWLGTARCYNTAAQAPLMC